VIDALKLAHSAANLRKNNMKFSLILLIIGLFFTPYIVQGALECQWTTFPNGNSCGQTLDQNWQNKEWTSYADNNCQKPRTTFSNEQQTTVCCCRQISSIKNVSPKYIIIGILIIIIGGIAGYFLVVKNNELDIHNK